jgi:3-oxoacyl-[acyl-carrier protein] reductase
MLRNSAAKQADPEAFWKTLPPLQLLQRIGTSDELARAALFLASDDSSYVTGTDILVDGGIVLG